MITDLRSDTVTRPTPEMLNAMFNAKVGDDVFGDDPTINALQTAVASYFGFENALYFPSGTMANQVAIMAHTNAGDEVICDTTAHVYRYEGGGIAANAGSSVRLLNGPRGIFTGQDVVENINSDDIHFPKSTLLVVENTVNKGGGKCWTGEQLQAVTEAAHQNNLKTHLDGARLWNALVATKQNPKDYSQWFNSISVCFSKGLGCPVGSVLIGDHAFIAKARRIRKRMGGGMRQAGFLAAACMYALNNHINRLADDHTKALQIAGVLKQLQWVEEIIPVETNIVLFKTLNAQTANDILLKLKARDIWAAATGNGWIRFVTHLDITDAMVQNLEIQLKAI